MWVIVGWVDLKQKIQVLQVFVTLKVQNMAFSTTLTVNHTCSLGLCTTVMILFKSMRQFSLNFWNDTFLGKSLKVLAYLVDVLIAATFAFLGGGWVFYD